LSCKLAQHSSLTDSPHQWPEGLGFSPAGSRASQLSPHIAARIVRRLRDYAGRKMEIGRGRDPAAGLKPRPSRHRVKLERHCGKPRLVPIAPLWAAIFACNLASLAQQAPNTPPPVNVDDGGVFVISLAGRPVGSEHFTIHSSLGRVEARGETRLDMEQNGKALSVQSFPDFVLDSQLHPLTYTWNQKGPQSSRLEVDFRGALAKARYTTISGSEDDRDFALPPDVMVLDDNVIHHYELIIARFLAMGGGKQTFHVFVPQEALPSVLTMEDMRGAPGAGGAAAANLRHLLITTDVTHIDLWVDEQQHLERVAVLTAQLEATRKK